MCQFTSARSSCYSGSRKLCMVPSLHFLTTYSFHLLPPKVNPKASTIRCGNCSLGPGLTEGSDNPRSPRKLVLRADIRWLGETFSETTREEFCQEHYCSGKGKFDITHRIDRWTVVSCRGSWQWTDTQHCRHSLQSGGCTVIWVNWARCQTDLYPAQVLLTIYPWITF